MSAKVHRISTAIRDGEIASVHVGPNATTYRIHKALLTQHSIYFKNALSGQWKESKEGIRLDDIDCQTFDHFVYWLYTQELPETPQAWICGEDHAKAADQYSDPDHPIRAIQISRLKAYVFGDRFQSAGYKKAVYDIIVDNTIVNPCSPLFKPISLAFHQLPDDDILLDVLVDAHCIFYPPERDTLVEIQHRNEVPREFLMRVMVRHGTIMGKLVASDYPFGPRPKCD